MAKLGLENYADFELEAIKHIHHIEDNLRNAGRGDEIVPDIIIDETGKIENFH
jgi:hypothetical protein